MYQEIFEPSNTDIKCELNLKKTHNIYGYDKGRFVNYKPFITISGVPRGGRLFHIFSSPCATSQSPTILRFADYMKLYMNIKSLEDCTLLQSDLVVTWRELLGLAFNIGKCCSMSFTRGRSPITAFY